MRNVNLEEDCPFGHDHTSKCRKEGCPCRDCEKSLKEAKSQLLQLVLDEVKKMKNTKTGSIEKIIGYDCVSWADGYCQALDDFSQRAREILT